MDQNQATALQNFLTQQPRHRSFADCVASQPAPEDDNLFDAHMRFKTKTEMLGEHYDVRCFYGTAPEYAKAAMDEFHRENEELDQVLIPLPPLQPAVKPVQEWNRPRKFEASAFPAQALTLAPTRPY